MTRILSGNAGTATFVQCAQVTGRFATLGDVVEHYNTQFVLGLQAQEKTDLVEYLKSL